MQQQSFIYQPPTQQQYQNKIYINSCDSYINSELIQQFRNDHIIQANPNIIIGSYSQYHQNNNHQENNHQKELPSGITNIIDISNQRLYNSVLLQSDIILFTLTNQNIKQFQYILKLLKNSKLQKQLNLICISELISWSNSSSKNISSDKLHLRNSNDYHIKFLQNFCLGIHNQNTKVKGSVIFSGLVYGLGENRLFSYFKRALQQQKSLQIYGKGTNLIPMIHLKDLTQIVYNVAFRKFNFKKNWFFAVDNLKITQNQLIKFIADNLGNGNIIEKPIDQSFIYENFNFMTIDLQIQEKDRQKLNDDEWHSKNGIKQSFQTIVSEFNLYRGLKPNKIIIMGPPVSGKTTVAEILKTKYGLNIISIKSLIDEIKADQSSFAQQIKKTLEQIKAIKVQQQRKIYEEMKKKKKGKGVEDFDPEKIIPRLPEQQLSKVLKWRLNFSDCLNKGYIIDNVIKTYFMAEQTFINENNQINQLIFPNSAFFIKATDQQIKQRVKSLPPAKIQGTHWNEQQTIRRLQTFQKQNQDKSLLSYFNGKVDIQNVQINYEDVNIFAKFIERNGPLGFTKQPEEDQNKNQNQNQDQFQGQNINLEQEDDEQEQQQEEKQQEQFNLEKLTPKQQKILNQKSRPIRQYLIDNVIPQITEGLLQICKDVPEDPIEFLINFLEKKNVKKVKE